MQTNEGFLYPRVQKSFLTYYRFIGKHFYELKDTFCWLLLNDTHQYELPGTLDKVRVVLTIGRAVIREQRII